jgi:flagellar assembly factor FliW
MPECLTKYGGVTAYSEDTVFEFPDGLIGFENETRFVPLQVPGGEPLVLLQSLITPQLCFLALPVRAVDPDYRTAIRPEDLMRLEFTPGQQPAIGEEAICLTLITIHEGGTTTANLLAPVVVNARTHRAVQCISLDQSHSHEYQFLTAEETSPCL